MTLSTELSWPPLTCFRPLAALASPRLSRTGGLVWLRVDGLPLVGSRVATALPGAITDTDAGITTTSRTTAEALGLLRGFWQRVWQRPEPPNLLEQQRRSWNDQTQLPPAWCSRLSEVTAQDCWRCAQRAKHSTAGPDGISGQELAWMPVAFWELLCNRLQRWQHDGQFPEVWRHCRTVFLTERCGCKAWRDG